MALFSGLALPIHLVIRAAVSKVTSADGNLKASSVKTALTASFNTCLAVMKRMAA